MLASSPVSGSSHWPRTYSTSFPAGGSTTTQTCSCDTRAGHAACSGAARSPPATRTRSGCRVYGEKGGLEWEQEEPNKLWFTPLGQPKQLLTRGGAGADANAARVSRTPGGHPEGYLEGFANIYAEAARAIRARREHKPVPKEVIYPTLEDGVAGVAFVEACVKSSAKNGAWVTP